MTTTAEHIPIKSVYPLSTFSGVTQDEISGQMEQYAIENLTTERVRIYTKLCQLLEAKEEITEEILKKLILGNRK